MLEPRSRFMPVGSAAIAGELSASPLTSMAIFGLVRLALFRCWTFGICDSLLFDTPELQPR
jgi:hypothetical protein